MDAIYKNIDSFKELEYNWNSYKGKTISSICIFRAKKIVEEFKEHNINITFAYPLPNGGIQLEYDSFYDMVMEVNPEGEEDNCNIYDGDEVLYSLEENTIMKEQIKEIASILS